LECARNVVDLLRKFGRGAAEQYRKNEKFPFKFPASRESRGANPVAADRAIRTIGEFWGRPAFAMSGRWRVWQGFFGGKG
jgi:hypothetical protein